jgi:hypothetical protein
MKAQQKRNNRHGVQKKADTKKVFVYLAVAFLLAVIVCIFIFFYIMPDKIAPKENNVSAGETLENKSEEILVPSAMADDPQSALNKAMLRLEFRDNKDFVKIVIDKVVGKGKEIIYRYEWTINGQSAGNGGDSVSGFKRGDKVAVRITLYDGDKLWLSRNVTMEISNTVPAVIENKESSFDGKMFTTQIKAKDPDGDTLSYELLSGPEGMTIDNKSGIVNWSMKENNGGDYPVKVKISDGHGGETTYQLTATIPKESPPPVTVPKKSP